MNAAIDRTKIDYFGGCPECGGNDGHLNVERTHHCVCHKHRVRWCVGGNLFSSWRHESEDIWRENSKILAIYKEVEPLPWEEPPASLVDRLLSFFKHLNKSWSYLWNSYDDIPL